MTNITLYEYAPTRSARPRWTLLEAGLPFESVGGDPSVFQNSDLREVHPLGKIPAAMINGKPLFESAAISTAIADLVPEKQLVPKPGSRDRTLHDQWTQFVLTEMEAWLWPVILNTFILPEDQRIAGAHLEQNAGMFKRGASALNNFLGEQEYLIDNRFGVTDIIAGYCVNAGRKFGMIDTFPHLTNYLDRLMAREDCTLDPN